MIQEQLSPQQQLTIKTQEKQVTTQQQKLGKEAQARNKQSKSKIFKVGKIKRSSKLDKNKEIGPMFNNPLYQYLDNDEYNKDKHQHNFGPWIYQEQMKNKAEKPRNPNPENNQTRYRITQDPVQEEQMIYHNELLATFSGSEFLLPQIRHRGDNHKMEYQMVKASSLEFQQQNRSPSPKKVEKRKTPPVKKPAKDNFLSLKHLKSLQTAILPKKERKSCHFLYNHCLEKEQFDLMRAKVGLGFEQKKKQKYFQLSPDKRLLSLGKFNNKILFKELKQHRVNKLK